MKHFFLITLFLVSCNSYSQSNKETLPLPESYPKNEFQNPLDITNYLSGNFGELRTNHFHSGLDIKTNQREGLKVYSAGDGFVSRINISPKGYGNAIYIDHPNGYTTVYAHLQKFNDKIEEFVRKHQYKNETFAVEVYPKSDELKISKGELIALSGNSGSSGGPHLHFEIRHTKSEEPINPFFFGFDVPDTKKPNINGLYIYPINGDVIGKKTRHQLPAGLVFNTPIYASGKIGLGVKAYDQHNGATNSNGVYKIETIVNGEAIFIYTANRFSFDETRAVNSLCDYEDIMKNNSWVYQLFRTDGNPLRLFTEVKNNGIIDLEEGKEYKIQIIVSDYAGNKTEAKYTIIGKKPPHEAEVSLGENYLYWNKENHFKGEGIEIVFPKGTFYEDVDMTYKKTDKNKHYIHNWDTPVHSHFSLSIEPQGIPTSQLDKAVIVREYQKRGAWKKSYEGGEYKNGKIIGRARDFGVFSLEIDNKKPAITAINIKENATFTKANGIIKFTISDSQSGIGGFSAYIDGKWVLSSYDQKIKRLSIDLNKEGISIGKHKLELKVWDEKNNTATYTADFNKSS